MGSMSRLKWQLQKVVQSKIKGKTDLRIWSGLLTRNMVTQTLMVRC